MKALWRMTVAKRDLVEAVGHARTRATLRRKGSGFENEVMLINGDGQLSIRSSHAAMDIPAQGLWSSPVLTNGPALRRLAPKLSGPNVTLTYVAGRLFLDNTSIPAREA
jgi:hypothetical protein